MNVKIMQAVYIYGCTFIATRTLVTRLECTNCDLEAGGVGVNYSFYKKEFRNVSCEGLWSLQSREKAVFPLPGAYEFSVAFRSALLPSIEVTAWRVAECVYTGSPETVTRLVKTFPAL